MENNKKVTKQKSKKTQGATLVELVEAALLTTIFCVLAPITVYLPISPVGFTFGTLLVYLTALLLGAKFGVVSVLLYLGLGFVGLPVFSGFLAGAGVLLGPTGGYLLGYLPCVWLVGMASKGADFGKKALLRFVLGSACGTLLIYLCGTLWFVLVYTKGGSNLSLTEVIVTCVLPFLPFDIIKITIAAVLFRPLKRVQRRIKAR